MVDRKVNKENKKNEIVPENEFKFKSIQTSCSNVVDYSGQKRYRTVYRLSELETLYVDTAWINKQYDEASWDASVLVGLFFMDGDKPLLVARKEEELVVPKNVDVFYHHTLFSSSDFNGFTFREGEYRVQVVVNGLAALSDEIHLLEAHENIRDYFKIIDVGFDRCCEEDSSTERPHSFNVLNRANLKDVRFYVVAENLLSKEWTYEFIINILDHNGMPKATRVAKGNYYVTNANGKRLLCFAVDLGRGLENFWEKGSYTVELFCFGQVQLILGLEIGDKDVPYRFTEEIDTMLTDESTTQEKTEESTKIILEVGDALTELYQLVGLRKVKEEITRVNELAEFVKMRQENGFEDNLPPMNMIFMGNPGTGKSTVAELIGRILYREGALKTGELHRYRRENFTAPGQAIEEQLIRTALTQSEGGILFIEDADELYPTNNPNDPAIRIWNILLNILDNEKPETLVILAGSKNELQAIAEGIPEIKRCFPTQLIFEDYSSDELVEIARRMLKRLQYTFTPEAEEKFIKFLKYYSTAKK